MIEIRKAHPSEYEMLASLGRRAFQEAFGEYNSMEDMQAYLDLAFHPETIKTHLADPDITFLIAFFKGDPVGYSKLKRNSFPPELVNKRCIQLERIYALQAFVGKKIGKALMEACLKIAKEENFESIWLSVWQDNQIAIKFYKQWGFKVIGYKQFVIGKEINDDYVMALEII